ncbi:hypothetical protein F5X98DRAFT_331251 [Xylaria grammica]|nr:hypothetical protein F5X98DRAFT_331251 [Xylaria grammica]
MPESPGQRVIRPSHHPPLLGPRERRSTAGLREARLHSPWKRSACDRCRSLKLKCERDNEKATRPCIRCSRADATCFTSSAKAPTRSARVRANAELYTPVCANTDRAEMRRGGESRNPIPATEVKPDGASDQKSEFVMRWPFTYHDEHATPDIDFDVDMPARTDESGQASYFAPIDSHRPPFHFHHVSSATPASGPANSTLHSELVFGADSGTFHSIGGSGRVPA